MQNDELDASYALAKKVPDMRQRGFRIETSYGEIDVDASEGEQITNLVERMLQRRANVSYETFHIAENQLSPEQRDLLDAFRAASKEAQNVVQIMGHHFAGKPWSSQMRLHLNSLAALIVHGEVA